MAAVLVLVATAACGPSDENDTSDPGTTATGEGDTPDAHPTPTDDGQSLDEYCAGLMIGAVTATTGPDGVTVTWMDGTARLSPTTYRILRRTADTTAGSDDDWTTVATVELDGADERHYLDDTLPADQGSTPVQYAVSVDDPNCGPSEVCPEAPDTCALVSGAGPAAEP